MLLLQKDEATAARRRIPIYLVDETDGVTPETSVTVGAGDVKISKDGGGEANHAGTLNELAGGMYYYEATAGELDTLGFLSIRLVKSGVRTFIAVAQVVAVDLYDDVRGGLTALPNAAAEAAGGLFTRGSGAGQINQAANGQIDAKTVDITHDAIDVDAIKTGAITAAKFAAGAIDADAIKNGAIDAATFAAGAIDAAAIAADAIDADAIKADAITEIQAGLATSAEIAAVQADTDDIQTRLPAALVGGKIDAALAATERTAVGTALLDLADGIETGKTLRAILRGIAAILLGKTSGGPGSSVFRDVNNSKDRVTTVADANGDRTTVTLDLT